MSIDNLIFVNLKIISKKIYIEKELYFPFLPKKGDTVSFMEKEDWIDVEVSNIIHQFDGDNKFEFIEIICKNPRKY